MVLRSACKIVVLNLGARAVEVREDKGKNALRLPLEYVYVTDARNDFECCPECLIARYFSTV